MELCPFLYLHFYSNIVPEGDTSVQLNTHLVNKVHQLRTIYKLLKYVKWLEKSTSPVHNYKKGLEVAESLHNKVFIAYGLINRYVM